MKLIVCDICKASEDAASGGLFNLKDDSFNVDVCGSCAVNVLATLLGSVKQAAMAAIQAHAKTPIKHSRPVLAGAMVQSVTPIDEDLDKFIAKNGHPVVPGQDPERQRIDALTAHIGEQVFVQELSGQVRIGSAVKVGMPGRKAARRVEVVEAVAGKPGLFYVFQVKD